MEPSNRKRRQLIEAVTQLSILNAVMKCMDDPLVNAFIEAMESNITKVKSTLRVQESCAVPEAFDPLAEGNLLLEQQEEETRTFHAQYN